MNQVKNITHRAEEGLRLARCQDKEGNKESEHRSVWRVYLPSMMKSVSGHDHVISITRNDSKPLRKYYAAPVPGNQTLLL